MVESMELFEPPELPVPMVDYLGVPGLTFHTSLLTADEQAVVVHEVDRQPWLNDLKRRVQHYGYRYDYTARNVRPEMFVGPLPPFAIAVAQKLLTLSLIPELPDQLIVNEYLPGQGISAHVDCEPCFKETITTVSLGACYEMDFIQIGTKEVRSTLLPVGSALVLQGDARYAWQHRIMARRSDHGVPRGRRLSLTFRNVLLTR